MIPSFIRVGYVVLAFALLLAVPMRAQEASAGRVNVPWGVGERLEYDVKFGKLKVGSGSMEVADIQDVRGNETWHTIFEVRGGTFFYRVNDTYESWFDTHTGNSLRFRKDQSEGSRDVEQIYNMFPERGIFIEDGDTAMVSVTEPLDDGSFLYFIRTIPLVVGESYSFERYFKPDRNPVTIKVLRKERISVPAGDFDAIVVQPVVKAKGIFSENGHAEVWLSDDKNRIMLQVKSALSFGSINLYLKSYRPARAAATTRAP